MTQPRHTSGRGWVSRPRGPAAVVVVALVVAAIGVGVVLWGPFRSDEARPDTRPERAPTSAPTSAESSPRSCKVGPDLVNPCRPWFGATANNYPGAPMGDKLAQMKYFERRTGRQMDVARTYHVVGDDQLSATDRYFATRARTILLTSWQPASDWSRADGSDPQVNAAIDTMGRSIKALGDTRIMFSVFHEPENDVSSAPTCPSDTPLVGTSGTPEQYRAMWHNVRKRFDALGVDNVVWVMTFMGYQGYNCLVDAVYPGDKYVDWILFNAYDQGDSDVDFDGEISNMYNFLTTHSGPRHDYLSKPWGLAEWGIYDSSQPSAYRYYAQARKSVEDDAWPNLELYSIFDTFDPHTGDGSYRVAYGKDGQLDPREQAAFNRFARAPSLNGGWTLSRQGQG